MFRKIFGLLSLERRLTEALQSQLNEGSTLIEARLQVFEKNVKAGTQQVDKFQADFNRRLSRLEVLLADELRAKEKVRDELVMGKRLGSNPDGN